MQSGKSTCLPKSLGRATGDVHFLEDICTLKVPTVSKDKRTIIVIQQDLATTVGSATIYKILFFHQPNMKDIL